MTIVCVRVLRCIKNEHNTLLSTIENIDFSWRMKTWKTMTSPLQSLLCALWRFPIYDCSSIPLCNNDLSHSTKNAYVNHGKSFVCLFVCLFVYRCIEFVSQPVCVCVIFYVSPKITRRLFADGSPGESCCVYSQHERFSFPHFQFAWI